MNHLSFTRGLHDVGNGVFACFQPDGGWGWSNAGLIADGSESLLVDTLFDCVSLETCSPVVHDAFLSEDVLTRCS